MLFLVTTDGAILESCQIAKYRNGSIQETPLKQLQSRSVEILSFLCYAMFSNGSGTILIKCDQLTKIHSHFLEILAIFSVDVFFNFFYDLKYQGRTDVPCKLSTKYT